MCGDTPDYNVTIAAQTAGKPEETPSRETAARRRGGEKPRANSERRPWPGRRYENPRQVGLPSVHLLRQPGWPLPTWPGLTRLPRLVARGYPAAVRGRFNVRSTFLRRNHRPAKP